MDQRTAAEACYAAARDADDGVSPIPCAQLLLQWGVSVMRRGNLERAQAIFTELDAILPAHVPGLEHHAEVALGREQLDMAAALVSAVDRNFRRSRISRDLCRDPSGAL